MARRPPRPSTRPRRASATVVLGALSTPAGQALPLAGPAAAGTAREAFLRLAALDLDGDGRLTAGDAARAAAAGRPFSVSLELGPGARLELDGPERLAHAADVLGEELLAGRGDAPGLPVERLLTPRSEALRALVAGGWDGLVRRADRGEDLCRALAVSMVPSPDGRLRAYAPAGDRAALAALRAEARRHPALEVVALPPARDAATWARLSRLPGMLYLPRPFVVPGGIFHEMYGWDSYFIARGCLATGRADLARAHLENYVYALERYGKIPNSNLTVHLSRTQPPFLPRLALELHAVAPDRALLARVARAAARELEEVFCAGPRRTPSGLSRYKDDADGAIPELETPATLSHYAHHPRDAEYLRHSRATRESGWDMTHRFGDRAHHHEPVCLNSLLYRYEVDLAALHRLLEGPRSRRAAGYAEAARARARVMGRRLWSEELGLFVDHDFVAGARSRYESAATFYPLWAGWASRERAARVVAALPRFVQPGGLVVSTHASRAAAGGEDLQWDWPYGWAPHQLLAVEGLRRYGYHAAADAIAYRWLSMLLEIAGATNGLLKEKYDVVRRSAEVPVEYGNQGADRGAHLAPRDRRALGFAWTNASYVLLLDGLPPALRAALDADLPADVAAPLPRP